MKKTFILAAALLGVTSAFGQALSKNLSEDGKTYVKASVRASLWARYAQTNDGTKMGGEAISDFTDFSMRRLRIGVQAQLTPKLYFNTSFGFNDLNGKTDATGLGRAIQVLDMHGEYAFCKEFTLGLGKAGWGSSRAGMRSSKSMLALDGPTFGLINTSKNDHMGRNMQVYAKGIIDKISYVAVVKQPFLVAEPKAAGSEWTDYATGVQNKQYAGYIKYDFWDVESNKTPFTGTAGTYVGTKKVLNIGIGGTYQKDMMARYATDAASKTYLKEKYNFKHYSAEVFMETPLSEKNNALTLFGGYYMMDYGKDYLRKIGSNDPTDNGGINSYQMGTGNVFYFQAAYLLGKSEKYKARIQPNLAIQYSDFDGLKNPAVVYDLGVNMFLKGHDRKLTLAYQNRPQFDALGKESRKGWVVFQLQMEIN